MSSWGDSAVSVGFSMWAILPLLVGGAELSLTVKPPLLPLLAEFHVQLVKVSRPLPPFEKGGGGGVSGLECDCGVAFCNEYVENESLMRWSSAGTERLGDEGH